MKITVNGEPADVDDACTVADLVRTRTDERRRVAVARNSEVVPRGEWDGTLLAEGDLVEVLVPVAGG
jgi:sulfur carrier protein